MCWTSCLKAVREAEAGEGNREGLYLLGAGIQTVLCTNIGTGCFNICACLSLICAFKNEMDSETGRFLEGSYKSIQRN